MKKEVSTEAHGGSGNTETIKQVTYKGGLDREGRSKGWGIKMGKARTNHVHTYTHMKMSHHPLLCMLKISRIKIKHIQ